MNSGYLYGIYENFKKTYEADTVPYLGTLYPLDLGEEIEDILNRILKLENKLAEFNYGGPMTFDDAGEWDAFQTTMVKYRKHVIEISGLIYMPENEAEQFSEARKKFKPLEISKIFYKHFCLIPNPRYPTPKFITTPRKNN